jgi:hypothetical protein
MRPGPVGENNAAILICCEFTHGIKEASPKGVDWVLTLVATHSSVPVVIIVAGPNCDIKR